MYVCMYVCAYACMYVSVYAWRHRQIFWCIFVCITYDVYDVCFSVYIWCMYVCMYVYMYVCMHEVIYLVWQLSTPATSPNFAAGSMRNKYNQIHTVHTCMRTCVYSTYIHQNNLSPQYIYIYIGAYIHRKPVTFILSSSSAIAKLRYAKREVSNLGFK